MRSKKGMIIEIEGHSIDINKIGYISPVKITYNSAPWGHEGNSYEIGKFEIILNDGTKIEFEAVKKEWTKEFHDNYKEEIKKIKEETEKKRELIFNKWKKGKTVYYIK